MSLHDIIAAPPVRDIVASALPHDRVTALTSTFATDGYAVVPVFDPRDVGAAQADIGDLMDRIGQALFLKSELDAPGVSPAVRLNRIAAEDRSLANLFRVAVCTDAHRGPRLSALADSPLLLDAAERTSGLSLSGAIVRVRASIAAQPEQAHGWHSDVAIDDGTNCSRIGVTAWIPLTDTGPEHGGLEIIPGKRPAPLTHRQDREFRIDEATLESLPRIQPVCPAGSVLFLDRFTPHRTLPVTTGGRFALVVWIRLDDQPSSTSRKAVS